MASSKKKAAAKKPAAKKPMMSKTAKVSPLKGMPVADWIKAKSSGWQAEMIERMLAVAKKAAPKATVSIKWGTPILESNGPIAFIKTAKAHVTFGFWRGAALDDAKGLLEGGDRMKHLKVHDAEGLDEKALLALVKQAVALNAELGDPTKR